MASPSSPVERQVARVSRRLFLQVFLDSLFWCWAGALVLVVGWFLVQPLVLAAAPEWLRWTVAGGVLAVATGLAVVLGALLRPSRLTAALSLDEKFGLRERVTTSLTLTPHQQATPAAAALLADVNQRVADLDVPSRFPVKLSWNAALLPLGGALLALVALFYEPAIAKPSPTPEPEKTEKVPPSDELEKKIAQAKLERKGHDAKDGEAEEKSDELKKFEEDMDRIFGKPRETKEQVEKRMDELADLKKKMEQTEKEMAEKAQALKDQLKQADRLNKKKNKDGPAKDLEKAINKGDMEKAKEEVDKLVKKMKNNELTKEEQQDLQDQIKDLKDQLQRLSREEEDKDIEEQLKELARKGEIDQEQLERELEQLKKNSEKLNDEKLKEDLEDIADALAECQRCMKEGDQEGAAKALKRAGSKMGKLDKNGELQQLAREIDQLEGIRRTMSRNMSETGNQPNPGAGRRPEEEDQTGSQRERITSEQDPKGRKEVVGTAPGSNFRKPVKQEDLVEVIKQARQEAPEALERQRIPRAAGDIAKGYFENLGGQKEPGKKGDKP